MSARRTSDWQARVLDDLAAFAEAYPDEVEMVGNPRYRGKRMDLRLRVRTAEIKHAPGGLRLRDYEEFQVTIGRSDMVPPRVEVDHLRFLDHAHVLQGTRLCLYLDPSREWDPANGFGGLVDRLLEWLSDAAAARFDAQTALYHAVGGVLHETDGQPTVVLRESLPEGRLVGHGWLIRRTAERYDLTLDQGSAERHESAEHVPVFRLRAALPLGAGGHLRTLLHVIEDPYAGHPAPDEAFTTTRWLTGLSTPFLTAVGASAIRKPDGTAQRAVLAVPHPTGGPAHLLVANIPAAGADHLRAMARLSTKRSSVITIDPNETKKGTAVEWLPVSDERPEVTTRRDSTRPVSAFAGKTVHVWGCGGLGSWVAEFVVRAGAAKVVLCDPGRITGGLLVRQNFVETDIGKSKVAALAARLLAIRDDVEVVALDAHLPGASDIDGADVVIDASVSVAVGRVLDAVAKVKDRPLLAQMACDVDTGTLGIMSVSMPPETFGCLDIDQRAGREVRADGTLEAFHALWGGGSGVEEIVPTRGCSAPTFHGSAADLSAVAASLTSILGTHLGSDQPASGTHLISLPHSEAGPLRRFVPVTAPAAAGAGPDGPGPSDDQSDEQSDAEDSSDD